MSPSTFAPFSGKAPHLFTGTFLSALPELNYRNLEEVSQLASSNGRESIYEPLSYALQRLQWAQFAGKEAISLDQATTVQYEPGVITHEYIAQVQHAKAVFDLLAHGKAALDSIAVFINDAYSLGCNGGDRDLKWTKFRQAISGKAPLLAIGIEKKSAWLDPRSSTSESIVAARDSWVHKGGTVVAQMYPPLSIGSFGIPRLLDSKDHNIANFWSTSDFVSFHMKQLFEVFDLVLQAAIVLERQASPSLEIQHHEGILSMLPMIMAEGITIHSVRVGELTQRAISAGSNTEGTDPVNR